ncbi:MAG: GTPase Era, partial [Gammaproteobacteria bacterium]
MPTSPRTHSPAEPDQDLEAMLARALGRGDAADEVAPLPQAESPAAVEPAQQRCGFVAIVGKPNV